MEKERICKFCNNTFNVKGRVFSNHVRWCNKNNSSNNTSGISEGVNNYYDKKLGILTSYDLKCSSPTCDKLFTIKERSKQFPKKEKYFCSRSCANKRIHSSNTKSKISKKMKEVWENEEYVKRHIEFISNSKTIFNSKGERDILKYLQKRFPHDKWTSGGALKYNNEILTRDIYSKLLKVNIEYDGIWHFKDIHGQLEKKQNKDKLLNKWSNVNNYRMIRISEDFYKRDSESLIKLIETVYNNIEQYVELY